MASKQQIFSEINAHMKNSGVGLSGWYVGIAADARARLFDDHKVNEKGGTWIYREAENHTIAREIESAYHDAGCKGGPGGGDSSTRTVYAYVITSYTVE